MKHEGLCLFSRTTNNKTHSGFGITKLPEDSVVTVPKDLASYVEGVF